MISKSQNKAEKAKEKQEAARNHRKVLKDRYGIGNQPQHFRGK